MEDEVVEDDDSGPAFQRVDDPTVRLRIVPDVVEGNVGGDGRVRPRRTRTSSTSRPSAGRSRAE